MSAAHRAQAARDACATLIRASGFLASGRSVSAVRPAQVTRPRVIGNGLRELDRFLEVMLIELGALHGVPPTAGRPRTAGRLGSLRARLRLDDPDQPRLHGLERSRQCLFFCSGVVRRGDVRGGATMTSGWYDAPRGALRTVAVGDTLHVSPAELADACAYYARLGERVLADALPA